MNVKLILLFSIFSILNFSCKTNQKIAKEKVSVDYTLKIYEGKIVKVQFIDKGGRVHEDIYSYYFETENEKLFIKIQEGKVHRDNITKYYNKLIKINGYKSFGLWDTDDPNVQSRVGDYIVIYDIIE